MKTVYYTGVDCGDGSISVSFYESRLCIELLEEFDFESHRGEGGGSFQFAGTLSGISIETIKDVTQYLIEWDYATEEQIENFIVDNS